MRTQLISCIVSVMLSGCTMQQPLPQSAPAPAPPGPTTGTSDSRPDFVVNTRLGTTDWSHITPWNPAITHLRIPGGSVGQYTWASWDDVPQWIKDDPKKREQQTIIDDAMMTKYLQFIQDKNVKNYWVLNINDELEDQMALLDRFIAKGLEVTHIELGNETYLPKFIRGEKKSLGFTHIITTEDYINIMRTWLPELRKKYNAQLLVVLASRNLTLSKGDVRRGEWNTDVMRFAEANKGLVDGYVVHVYVGKGRSAVGEEEASGFEFSYMDEFKMPIHITEGGNLDSDWSPEGIAAYKHFQRSLHSYLKSRNDGSVFGAHVLYNHWPGVNHPHAMYNPKGITPIGRAAMEFPHEK